MTDTNIKLAAPNILNNSGTPSLASSTQLAANLMSEIQQIVNSLWKINYNIPGGGGTLSGSPNNLNYSYSQTYQDSGTIVPGVPAVTITPAYVVPAVVTPAVSGCCTVALFGNGSTTEIPGTPAYTTTPAYTVPAVVSPAVPALTGGYSTELEISANVQGISNALNPLFSSVTFTSGTMTAPNGEGLATETVTYNLDQVIEGSAIQITGRASFDNLSVDIGGVTTNFGDVSTGNLSMSPVPNIPIYFNAIIAIPSYNTAADRVANGVAYELFPQATSVSVDDLKISSGVTAIADFISNDLLSYLTNFWNTSVVPLFTAVGATAPTAPSQTLANTINNEAESLQNTINSSSQSALNSLLNSQLSTIQPYVQAITAAVWDYENYPIVAGGDYSNAILASGLFSGVNVSNSSFANANCSLTDFSYANLTDCDFTGANLAGANLTGAMGYAAPALQAASLMLLPEPTDQQAESGSYARMEESPANPFDGAVLFGADLTDANLNLTGAFFDYRTEFSDGFNAEQQGLRYFSAQQFVAGNRELVKAYGMNYSAAETAFAFDDPACGCQNKPGLRTDVLTGALQLDGFNEDRYYSKLSKNQRTKVNDYLTANPDVDDGDFLATRALASVQPWTQYQTEQFLFSNSDLIEELGGVKKAMKKAQKYYVKTGIYENRYYNNKSLYAGYVQDYPSVVQAIGSTIDEGSLAHQFIKIGYAQGQIVPTEFM